MELPVIGLSMTERSRFIGDWKFEVENVNSNMPTRYANEDRC